MDERLAAILNAGLETTTLPSGMEVRGVRPTVEDLIRRRLIPTELRKALAAQGGKPDQPEDEVDPDEAAEVAAIGIDYLDYAAAAFLQEYRFGQRAAWRPLSVSVDEFRRMSPEDREHLTTHMKRAKEVADLAPFRDVDGGPDGGADGGEVAHDPKPAPARARRRRVVRAR